MLGPDPRLWCPQPGTYGLEHTLLGTQPHPDPAVRTRLWEGQIRHTPGARDSSILLGGLSPDPAPSLGLPQHPVNSGP